MAVRLFPRHPTFLNLEKSDPASSTVSECALKTTIRGMIDFRRGLRSSRVTFTAFTIFYCVSLWLMSQQSQITFLENPSDIPDVLVRAASNSTSIFNDVRNATLGFGKVFVINMRERTDKLDAIILAASLTGFHVDVIEGVIGKEISLRALPMHGVPKKEDWHKDRFDNVAGCWRSHVNFAQRVVSENLLSALVMEDDADWSVYLKDQLNHFATGSRYISDPSFRTRGFSSPYGNDWDLLWLGHCGSSFRDDTPHYLMENDPTVPPAHHRPKQTTPDLAAAGYDPDSTRVVYTAGGGLCTQAYALSLRGARRILHYYGAVQTSSFAPIDLGIHELCRDQPFGFKCVAVFPTLWGSHRDAGPKDRDSDIQTVDEGTEVQVREKGEAHSIVHSVRLNAGNLVKGEEVTSQWDDMPELEGGMTARYL